jgi:hypothetical protein
MNECVELSVDGISRAVVVFSFLLNYNNVHSGELAWNGRLPTQRYTLTTIIQKRFIAVGRVNLRLRLTVR